MQSIFKIITSLDNSKNLFMCFAVLFFGIGFHTRGQQDAGFSQYFFNQLYINPAYAGSRDVLAGSLVHRSQWVKMPGAPTTQSLTLHTPFFQRAGIGLQAYRDQIGPLINSGIQASYAYYIPLGRYRLSFGMGGVLHNLRISYPDIFVEDHPDPSFNGSASSWVPDVAFGAYLYRNRFYAGVSALHLFEPSLNLGESEIAKWFRQYCITTGYVFNISEQVDFRPSALLKTVEATPSVTDLNASLIFYQKLFTGIGFRTSKRLGMGGFDNQLIAIVELYLGRNFRLGYSYDWYLNQSGNYSSGTHEILLGWDIQWNKTRMNSPKFF